MEPHNIENVEVQPHALQTLALDGGEWLASHFGQFTLGKDLPESFRLEGVS